MKEKKRFFVLASHSKTYGHEVEAESPLEAGQMVIDNEHEDGELIDEGPKRIEAIEDGWYSDERAGIATRPEPVPLPPEFAEPPEFTAAELRWRVAAAQGKWDLRDMCRELGFNAEYTHGQEMFKRLQELSSALAGFDDATLQELLEKAPVE